MKITPSHQTLILASERRNPVTAPGSPPGRTAATTASAGSVLQRLTIVAARPDTTVLYLRADYSPVTEAAGSSAATYSGSPGASSRAASGTSLAVRQSAGTTRDAYGNAFASGSGTSGISSYLNPVEHYAQTQRILSVTSRVPQIDVHA